MMISHAIRRLALNLARYLAFRRRDNMPSRLPNSRPAKNDQWVRVAVIVVALGIALYSAWHRQANHLPAELPPPATQEDEPPLELPSIVLPEREPQRKPEVTRPPDQKVPAASRTIIARQTIRDEGGGVVYRGDVDVGPTLSRISRDERLRFSHDGIVFQNRERRLPRKPAGYYHEFVHPTPGVGGPGPQRIVMGREGETYYTPDHYRTFQRLDE